MYNFKPLTFMKHRPQSSHNPLPRSGHRIVCNDSNMYSFGGFNPIVPNDREMDEVLMYTRPLFKELWSFNLTTQKWTLMQNQTKMPNELASNAAILKGNTIMIHGGSGVPFGHHNNNKLYFCNIVDGRIDVVPTRGNKPDPQYGQAIVCHGKYFYSIGGTDGFGYNCDIHRLDLTTNVWESVYICSGKDQCEPSGRYRHEVAFDGKKIYIFGGGTAEDIFTLAEIPAFDIEKNKWSTLVTIGDGNGSAFPPPRRCHGLVQYTEDKSGQIYVVISGGYNDRRVLNDMWRLNLNTLKWKHLPQSLPMPVYFHSVSITPSGCMYSFGGITKCYCGNDEEGPDERTNAIHSIWLFVPKLTEICWLALNYYYPELKCLPKDQLLQNGIPAKFLKRLEDCR